MVGDPTRSLHVYSDVAGSSVVGNRVTDLLREIQYKREGRGTMYFEPLHIQYLPLRNEVVEIIHIQVAETIGTGRDLVKFVEGHTMFTLHFKKTKRGGLEKGVSNQQQRCPRQECVEGDEEGGNEGFYSHLPPSFQP